MVIHKFEQKKGFSTLGEGALEAGVITPQGLLSATFRDGKGSVFKILLSREDVTFIKKILGED